ncbi:MAG: hypothetical protein JWM88_949 [Verrucomicrobia bacterium]|nr:hypothetical protein [Verrucomicrobiota bacterium]
MRAWRIALEKFARTKQEAFSGLSGFTAGGRWHAKERHLDYAAESLSLATLERLVHYKRFDALNPHVVYQLEVPDGAIQRVGVPPKGWDGEDPLPAAQAIGNRWCDRRESPALLVPSAVTRGEHNLLLNPRHADWKWSWVVAGPAPFAFDARLLEAIRSKRSA